MRKLNLSGSQSGTTAPSATQGGAKLSRSEERINALKAAGIDVSSYYALKSATGDVVVKVKKGVPTVVEDDEITSMIERQGTIPDRNLFRRWVMSQVFHMLATGDYNAALEAKGYDYQWKMLAEEFRVQAILAKNDKENFEARNRWFNRETLLAIANDYKKKLEDVIAHTSPVKHFGEQTLIIGNRAVAVKDVETKVITPVKDAIMRIEYATTAKALDSAVFHFNTVRKMFHLKFKPSGVWKSAYKGSGAYFTLRNLLMFHGAFLVDDNGVELDQAASLEFLEEKATEYRGEFGYRLFGFLKKAIADNNIDIEAKIQSWCGA